MTMMLDMGLLGLLKCREQTCVAGTAGTVGLVVASTHSAVHT